MTSARLYISEIPRRNQKYDELGITIYEIDAEKKKLAYRDKLLLNAITGVSCADMQKGLLYVIGEETDPVKQRSGGDRITVIRMNPDTGDLLEICQEFPTLSPNPVYITLDQEKKTLLVANHATHNKVHKLKRLPDGNWGSRVEYDDSTVVLYSLQEDGLIGKLEDVVIHEGSGPLRTQTHAHPHSAVWAPSGKLFAVCDKGADTVSLYQVDRENMRLRLLGKPWVSSPGDEPRFCAFHPTQNFLYVNHEGNLGLDVLKYTEEGGLEFVQNIDLTPPKEERQPGRIYEHQGISMDLEGKYLYSVARGVDAIVVYRIQVDGTLTMIEMVPVESEWPRCCELTPDGKWLLVGTRDGGDLILFEVGEDGRLCKADSVRHPCGVAYITACSE